MGGMRVGIDVGGTFTDVVLIDVSGGRTLYAKVLTTPANPAEGVMRGIARILEIAGVTMAHLDYVVHGHGTTIGTNALIERKGAPTGLVTTEGFRDVLEIARIERPDEGLYDFNVDTPAPLVPRSLRLGVRERIGAKGEIVTPLVEEDARRAARLFRENGIRTVAVSTLFSFKNPVHERRIREIFREEHPEALVSLSSEIAPEFREFERTSTTVINAYLAPIVERYLGTLQRLLAETYGQVEIRIMQASGGAVSAEMARARAVATVNSGPAGGAVGSCFFGRLAGEERLITVDMGGTSFDIGLVDDGKPRITSDGKFEGYPVRVQQVDVHAIGAGGGSIAWIDRGGALCVGPRSAAAEPGPACYGRGGELPTVTDANLVLGRIAPDYFLGGEMRLHPELAASSIRRHVAEPLSLDLDRAASGILRVVNANMAKGIRSRSIERGYDPREFTLVAFGGAGPLHAAELADDLGMRKVLVPLYPGALSAFGLATSDIRHDHVATLAKKEKELTPEVLAAAFAPLEDQARRDLAASRVPPEAVELARSVDMRYIGQSYELNVPLPGPGDIAREDLQRLIQSFHALHRRIYEYGSLNEETEVVNVRIVGLGRVPPVSLPRIPRGGSEPSGAWKGERLVHFDGPGHIECPIYERGRLRATNRVVGPAVIEERISCTVVPPGWTATTDDFGNLILAASAELRHPEPANSRPGGMR